MLTASTTSAWIDGVSAFKSPNAPQKLFKVRDTAKNRHSPKVRTPVMNRDISLGNWLSFPASTPHRIAYFPHVKLNMLLFILIFRFSWEPSRKGLVPRALSTREPHGSFMDFASCYISWLFSSPCMWSLEFFFSELSVVLTSWLGFFVQNSATFPHASSQVTMGRAVWQKSLKS